MTGTHTQNPLYSRITLALMEDTGWYLPNYDMADPLKWGRGLGCDFVLKSCLDWMIKKQKVHVGDRSHLQLRSLDAQGFSYPGWQSKLFLILFSKMEKKLTFADPSYLLVIS